MKRFNFRRFLYKVKLKDILIKSGLNIEYSFYTYLYKDCKLYSKTLWTS